MGVSESMERPPEVSSTAAQSRRRSVKVELGANSPHGRGLKSLLSEPMDKLVTVESAWEALEHLLRSRGYALGAGSSAVSDFSTVSLGSNTFLAEWTVKSGAGQQAPVVLLHEFDRRSREWIMRKYLCSPPTEDGLEITHFLKFHRAPLRVESWSARRGSARRPPGKELQANLEAMLAEVLKLAKVPPRPISSTVRSWGAVSEPIEELTPEKFWKAYGVVARREAEEAQKAGAKLSPVPGGFAISKDGKHWSSRLDKKRDEWVRADHGFDDAFQQVECLTITKVHNDPFRVQVWSEQPLVRFPGSPDLKVYLEELLSDVVEQVQTPSNTLPEEAVKSEM